MFLPEEMAEHDWLLGQVVIVVPIEDRRENDFHPLHQSRSTRITTPSFLATISPANPP